MNEFLRTVNWRTTGYGVGYVVCTLIIANLVPSLADICAVADKLIVGAALVSTVDAARVRGIVRAVDAVAFKVKIDPATLTPTDGKPLLPSGDPPPKDSDPFLS